MRIIEADQHGVYDITDLPRQQVRRVPSPVAPDPLAPPAPRFPRFRFTDETFSTRSADSYRRQALIDEMMIAHLARTGPGGFVFITTTS